MSAEGAANVAKPADKKTGGPNASGDAVIDTGKVKDKLNALKEKLADNAAALNDQIAKNADKLRERINAQDSDDEDDESSDEETEETLFGDNATTGTGSTAAATAVTVRSQMPPSFISLEEEETIRTQLRAAKTLRKRLRKLKKFTSSSLKHTLDATARLEKLLVGVNAATEGPCTDPGIQTLASTSADNMKSFREGGNYDQYKTRVTEQVVEQMKPLMDHAKYLSIVGKERRQARNKRIQLERGELDVSDEAAYLRSVDIVKAFDDKSAAYKDEFRSLTEHNSSQVGEMLKELLLESATYYEALARVLRSSADSVATNSNPYMTAAAVAKFKNYEAPVRETLLTAPGLFSAGNDKRGSAAGEAGAPSSRAADDRLTAKPTARLRDQVVTGIPMTESGERRQQAENTYSTASYVRGPAEEDTTVSRTRRAVENFLNTGVIPQSTPAATRTDAGALKNTTDSMRDIRYFEEMYGIAWPGSPSDEDADGSGTDANSTRSLTPTNSSILPTIVRQQRHYFNSGEL